MIQDVARFIAYFESIRRRTMTYIRTIPEDHLDWAPKAAEFTCSDLVGHIAAAEQMYVGVVMEGHWHYPGHTRVPHTTLKTLIAEIEDRHTQAMQRLQQLPDSALMQTRPTLVEGSSIKVWRWLMAMVEHEIHHRSQLAVYLTLMGVTPPHIYGMGVEEVIARATG